jgi:hypothetical protein
VGYSARDKLANRELAKLGNAGVDKAYMDGYVNNE